MSLKDEKQDRSEGVIIHTPEIKKPKNIRLLVDEFPLDPKLSPIARAGAFFAYLAKKAPYQFCPPNLALKAVQGYAKCPRDTSDDVIKFRRKGSSIRRHLAEVYEKGLVVLKPLGLMRATVDDEDLATTQQVSEVARIRSSVAAAKRTNALITLQNIRDPGVRTWLKSGVSPLLKALTEDDRIFRLMPAKPKDEADEE